MPQFKLQAEANLLFTNGLRGNGLILGSLAYELTPDGGIELRMQELKGSFRDVTLDANAPPLVSGMCRIAVREWSLSVDAPVALTREQSGRYRGDYRLVEIPQEIRRAYERSPVIQNVEASLRAEAHLRADATVTKAVAPKDSDDLVSEDSIQSLDPAIVTTRLAVAMRHAEDIKKFLSAHFVQHEPSDVERALLVALQVEVDTITENIATILNGTEDSIVSEAISHVGWFVKAVKGVAEVASLAVMLNELLAAVGH